MIASENPCSSLVLQRIPLPGAMTARNRLWHKASRRTDTTKGMETMAVNTIDIAERLADTHGLSKTQAKTVVEDVLKGIAEAAAKGEEISLNGFGKFKVQNKPAREGRNPSTGATIKIAASKKVVFQPAKALKDAVNG
ncbi:HU family DNA-binding protein [Mesorhizobium sp. M4B.F.Ca.ET.169.01.1.1]|uniref:HU family DNA-binding protein n=1 Tax=unclassified Mesorhizobium TaxID=325217 RepID=UPI0032AFFDE3